MKDRAKAEGATWGATSYAAENATRRGTRDATWDALDRIRAALSLAKKK